jgi:serine/threonine-protein kinase
MGVVYRAIDRASGEPRALKRMRPDAASDPKVVEAFEREYQTLASIEHPRIIRVYDYGIDARGPYYAMELVEGQDLRSVAPVPFREACIYLRDIATSLALLHARRLLHRDLSPANVRKTLDGHCKLLDFGALTAFGYSPEVVGTASITPRESLEGAPLDQRADLYSLGALGYFMLTGRHAYPAENFQDLFERWNHPVAPPSSFSPDVPRELDGLIAGLLSHDPRARPASAAEVIARLGSIGGLGTDGDHSPDRIVRSFLSAPAFIGRTGELANCRERAAAAVGGHGSALRIVAMSGLGRTRFLAEATVRAELAGAAVLNVDATTGQRPFGLARALVMRAFDALPDAAQEAAARHPALMRSLGKEVTTRLAASAAQVTETVEDPAEALASWFVEVSHVKALVLEVDNVEYADPQSVGVLATLAMQAESHPLVVVVTESLRHEEEVGAGLSALRAACAGVTLRGLDPAETRLLARSLFGDAPSIERFADWLHAWTAGNPLHSVEVARQLVREGVVRYADGVWVLPTERPETRLPSALAGALAFRVAALGEGARGLAECLSLGRNPPTLSLCRALHPGAGADDVSTLLEELVQNDVLDVDRDAFRFSSTALRDAFLTGLTETRSALAHRRLGEAFSRLAAPDDLALCIEAGFHLIEGGEELRGADAVASATHDSVAIRTLIANLHHVGKPIEAALLAYKRHRRSVYERMPLLSALAQAGFYEARVWGERYGDEALDVLEEISGLRTARRAKRFLGQNLALFVGLLIALVRFRLTARSERGYTFAQLLVQLFGTVTALAATAAQAFDPDRVARVANVLAPFSGLPERLTPVGIYRLCRALEGVGREHQAESVAHLEELLSHFEDPRYYPTLPAEGRRLYLAALHLARGSITVMCADGRRALESADGLEKTGLKLYAMIASQLRYLYHMNRGEQLLAAPHREKVELHAAQAGSAWQVEAWEASALIPVSTATSDIVSLTHICNRLEELARKLPSLKHHSRLANLSLMLAQNTSLESGIVAARELLEARPARSHIGWAAGYGFVARAHNELGQFDKAVALCEYVLSSMTDADREFVALFLIVDIEMAIACAALGRVAEALDRLDGLLRRFESSGHPWVLGRLHETRARIAWQIGNRADYERSRKLMDDYYRPTGTSVLLARCERIAELGAMQSLPPASHTSMSDAERQASTVRADASGRRAG